ncbi:hypothetical protein COOONC_20737 [Cooperia oncophora]
MSFLNLVDFDGSIKRNKKQEAVLNTFNDREKFLRELEAQRRARAVDQKQKNAAIVVQRSWRAHRARIIVARQLREDFDKVGRPTTNEALNLQITRINVFYHHPDDDSRLITLCSTALGLRSSFGEEELVATQRRIVFYKCLLKFLSHAGKDTNFVMPIRFLDTFAHSQDCISLVRMGYFECFLNLIAKLAPPHNDELSFVTDRRLPPRLESLCEHLMVPVIRTSSEERVWALRSLIRSIVINKNLTSMVLIVMPYISRCFYDSKVSLCDLLNGFGRYPSHDTVPAGLCSTFFVSTILRACSQKELTDEEKFLLLSTCAGFKEAYQRDNSAGASMMTNVNKV